MWNAQQSKMIELIRELTLDELNAVSGGDGVPTPNCTGDGDPRCGPPPPDCPWYTPSVEARLARFNRERYRTGSGASIAKSGGGDAAPGFLFCWYR